MSKSFTEIMAALAAPFSAADVDWRVTNTAKDRTRGLAAAYVKSRAIQSRLDQVVGPQNWKTEYKPWHSITENTKDGPVNTASQLCGLSIYCEERGEWIQKWDGAEDTDYEPVKGGISDSFKRAAVLWGVGRYLYGLTPVWVDIEQRGKSYVIINTELHRLTELYAEAVNAPPSGVPANVSSFPGQPQKPPPFEYAVQTVEERQFATGNGMVLRLKSADGKESLEAFLQRTDNNLAEGVCLKNVKLTPFDNNGYRYHTMDAYEVA